MSTFDRPILVPDDINPLSKAYLICLNATLMVRDEPEDEEPSGIIHDHSDGYGEYFVYLFRRGSNPKENKEHMKRFKLIRLIAEADSETLEELFKLWTDRKGHD